MLRRGLAGQPDGGNGEQALFLPSGGPLYPVQDLSSQELRCCGTAEVLVHDGQGVHPAGTAGCQACAQPGIPSGIPLILQTLYQNVEAQ